MTSCTLRMRPLMVAILVLISLAGTTGSTALAQTTNTTVNGTVKDEKGAVVPGATVTLVDMATNREVKATTNGEGVFVFTEVRSGQYSLVAEASGFKRTDVRDIKVNVGTPATVNLELQTGGVSETVITTASDSQALVNTESGEIARTVLEKQINDLPLNGRNPVQWPSSNRGSRQSPAQEMLRSMGCAAAITTSLGTASTSRSPI